MGYPKGSAAELLDGILKLRYCTIIFTKQFLLGFHQGWVLVLVKEAVTSGNLLECGG